MNLSFVLDFISMNKRAQMFDGVWFFKFFVLFVPFTIFIWVFAPTIKWKIMYTGCGAIGIGLALSGMAMKGPMTRGKF